MLQKRRRLTELANRGSAGSYQKWAEQVGDPSYTFSEFSPYFLKSVQFYPPGRDRPPNASARYDPATLRSTGSPLKVGFPSWVNGISSWIARSLTSLGIPELPGFTSGRLLGWSYVALTMDPQTQTRSSSSSSFLREALQETTNLQIYKSTVAKKILFDEKNRAIGVLVDSGGFEYEIMAGSEVIVSAGAVSFVPCSSAESMRSMIDIIVDQRVVSFAAITYGLGYWSGRDVERARYSCTGRSTWSRPKYVRMLSARDHIGWLTLMTGQDHVLFGSVYAVDLTTHSQLMSDPKFLAASAREYNERRTGILTNVGGDLLGTASAKNPW